MRNLYIGIVIGLMIAPGLAIPVVFPRKSGSRRRHPRGSRRAGPDDLDAFRLASWRLNRWLD